MAKKQLDLNAPLLSVRKISPSLAPKERTNKKAVDKAIPPSKQHSLPVKRSEWELCGVTKPAAVPFVWEQTPGRPKDDNETRANLRVSSPRLPPGRLPESIRFYSGERPRSQNIYKSPADGLPWIDHAALLDSLAESIYTRGKSDRESEDDAYSDALEAMSPTESLSLNCSISGLSGHQGSDLKPSGNFSIDSQTRDFMMNRFLPAAKAVVLETPQYVQKKQAPVTTTPERPKPAKKPVPVERKQSPAKRIQPNLVSYYSDYAVDLGSETEDDVFENKPKKPSKAWKFLPRICVKNSLCLLNPLPGLKVKTQAPTNTVQAVKRVSGVKPKTPTSYAHEIKKFTRKAYSGPLEKNACDTINKQRFHSGLLSRDLYRADSRSLSGQLYSSPRDSCKLVGISPGRNSRSGAISPYRNVAPPSSFNEGARFLGVPKEMESLWASRFDSFRKGCYTVKDKLPHQMGTGALSDSPSNAVEKTLYVDSVQTVKKSAPINAAASKPKGVVNPSGNNMKTMVKSSKMIQKFPATARVESPKDWNMSEKVSKQIVEKETPDLEEASSLCISEPKVPLDQGFLKLKQNLDPVSGALESSKVHPYGSLGPENVDNENVNDPKDSNLTSLQSPLPPPLPKSPSESWLWRTLPSIPLRTPFLGLSSKKQNQKPQNEGTKWETIVKTTNLHKDHVRYSEELYSLGSCQQNKA